MEKKKSGKNKQMDNGHVTAQDSSVELMANNEAKRPRLDT